MWQASVSRQNRANGRLVATQMWGEFTMAAMIALLERVVGPAGNKARQRIFRMGASLNLQRALTDQEVEQLPNYFCEAEPVDLAGGPIEILHETEPAELTCQPCHNPTRTPISRNEWIWLPTDCGVCPPCVAREELSVARLRAVGLMQ